jgi:glycosyltransferase involved in cell wall biosynthesis
LTVLLVNQLAIPVFQDIANAVAESGSKVFLFTGKVEQAAKPLHRNVKVIHSVPYNRKYLAFRLASWLAFSTHLGLFLLFKGRFNRVLTVTNPPLSPYVINFLNFGKKWKIALLVYDLYPDALAQAGMSGENSIIFKAWQSLNKVVFPRMDWIITLSKTMKLALEKYAPDYKIEVIPNWVDMEAIKIIPRDQNKFLIKNGWKSKFIIMYSGNMGYTHDLESLLMAAHDLVDIEEIHFVLIGHGGKRKKLEDMSASLKLSNVTFLSHLPYSEFAEAISSADMGVITLGEGAEGISVPSKTYTSMAAGHCLLCIAPASSELAELIQCHNVGFRVSPGDHLSVANSIRTAYNNPKQLKIFKDNSRTTASYFDKDNAKKFVQVLN